MLNQYRLTTDLSGQLKKGGASFGQHAGQPINGDGTAGGVAPELDELLDGEDTS
jgi:hypothetical protein